MEGGERGRVEDLEGTSGYRPRGALSYNLFTQEIELRARPLGRSGQVLPSIRAGLFSINTEFLATFETCSTHFSEQMRF